MPQSTAPAGVAATDPTATGGGLTTPTAGQPVDMAALVPVLQQLVSALQALVQALGGAGAVTAGGATGAMGAPSAAAAGARAGAAHTGHAPTKGGGGSADEGHGDHGGHAGHKMETIARTAPVDRAQADYVRTAVRDFFGSVPRSAVQLGGEGNNHGRLPDDLRRKFAARYPGVPVPTGVVYPKQGGNAPVGVVYNQPNVPNLPMGNAHRHAGSRNVMQHIWFGGDLDRAYSDLSMGGAQTMFKLMQRQGLA